MKKKILFIILVAISIFMCFPVIFLLAGSFMGADELNTYLAPVLAEKSKGYVSWGLLPSYPTFSIMWNCFSMSRAIMSCFGTL